MYSSDAQNILSVFDKRLRCKCQVEKQTRVIAWSWSTLFSSVGWNESACVSWKVQGGREGASPGWFKLLSVNVTPCYLDSNYTCQLSLSPHLSLSLRLRLSVCLFKPSHTPLLSVFDKTKRSFFSFLLCICNLPPCQSVLRLCRFSSPTPTPYSLLL